MPTSHFIIDHFKGHTIPIALVFESQYESWFKKQPDSLRQWLQASQFRGKVGQSVLVPGANGTIEKVIACVNEPLDIWSIAALPSQLPPYHFAIETKISKEQATDLALGWALATYEFTRYKKSTKRFPTLVVSAGCDTAQVESFASSICWARDLINTPANDMHPEALAEEAVAWAQKAGGKVRVIVGEQLVKTNFPLIYAVGKAASVPPHLVDITFARKGAPRITLVGKGVCFDSGGLDIKPSSNMKLMKKDMGGAANTLALARIIIEMNIPVQLRVILPIVENAVSGNAMRPLDVVTSRKGLTVEIGNTDAEGRLILADALALACEENPDLLIDFSTLTGAARVALGTDIPAFFTPSDALAISLQKHSAAEMDLCWRLPLWNGYRSMIDTANADLTNDPESGMGGAITAALFLQEFVGKGTEWMHLDLMAWNLKSRAGRPKGGEVMGIRAIYKMIKERYGNG